MTRFRLYDFFLENRTFTTRFFSFLYSQKIMLFLGFLFLYMPFCLAQKEAKIAIASIEIEGNKKTKRSIILRELDFAVGDSLYITDLKPRLESNQQNVQNTGLFVTSEINIGDWNTTQSSIDLRIVVRETWYIYPYPIFELADRNFNVWWTEQRRSLRRVNYGISLEHNNLTGRRDRFKLTVQDGYTKKYELDYNLPGINKKQTIGVFGNIYYARRKEIAYITQANKLQFFNFDDEFQLQRFRVSAGLSLRPKIYQYHTFKLQWSDNSIGHQIGETLNPEYFLNDQNRQRHLTFWYQFAIDRRDIKPYPLNGFLLNVELQRDGFGISQDVNALSLVLKNVQYFSFGKQKKWSVELFGKIRSQLIRQKQPYTHVSSLGYYENVLRGYEYYVVDGMDFGIVKTSLRYEVLNNKMDFGKYMPLHAFKVLPFRVYFSLHNDTGYVNSIHYQHYGTLHNKWLYGYGLGLDMVLYHDKIFRIQYSFNHLGENGLFLQFNYSGS